MSRLTDELLRRWDEDPDAGFLPDSPFTKWWASSVQASLRESTDSSYRRCVESLNLALIYTVHATQSDLRGAPSGLRNTMEAMELWRGCDLRMVPDSTDTFDLEDLDQAILLVAFQYDPHFGSDHWREILATWFADAFRTLRESIALGKQSPEIIAGVLDDGENVDLDKLDDARWVAGMLEWFKLEDPRRDIGIDLDEVYESLATIEEELRPVLPNLRSSGVVARDSLAPRSFWWRH